VTFFLSFRGLREELVEGVRRLELLLLLEAQDRRGRHVLADRGQLEEGVGRVGDRLVVGEAVPLREDHLPLHGDEGDPPQLLPADSTDRLVDLLAQRRERLGRCGLRLGLLGEGGGGGREEEQAETKPGGRIQDPPGFRRPAAPRVPKRVRFPYAARGIR
jgi:hypothetical protein